MSSGLIPTCPKCGRKGKPHGDDRVTCVKDGDQPVRWVGGGPAKGAPHEWGPR